MAQSRSTLGILTALLILGALATGIWWRLRPPPEEEEDQMAEVSEEVGEVVESVREQFSTELPQPVTGVVAIQDTLWISVRARGRAEAFREAKLTAQKSGIISTVGVRENQAVGTGALVVQIDTTEYALEVATMEAALRKAQSDYRTRVLFDEELEDPEVRRQRDMLARAQTGLDQAEVDLRRAQLDLAKTAARVPFGGRVADLRVVAGQFVREGDELLTVVDIDPIKVLVQVLATEVVHLAEGRAASLVFTAFPGETFTGRIETINPVIDPELNTARVTVHIPNPDGRIKPGMYAEADLEAQQFPDRILVPKTAIRETDDRRDFLFVMEDGRAKWRYVTVGLENDYYVELLEGDVEWVAAGEIVLVDGHQMLPHDAAVELVDDPMAAGGRPTR
ncbi:MAG: efflux RND transporter periplasmic adaptor subunit [Gemmatimonadota bacterium]|nr:efflux RND transporter periplasmic adaptor subunit [Gemmatimonadota bacterium]MDE2864760.1 efflux RND transporter periplasmic adaptor subunit [Gemmatimonadota bacterium]